MGYLLWSQNAPDPIKIEWWLLQRSTSSVGSHLSYPGPLQLSLAISLLVEQSKCFSAGGWRRSQAGAVTHRETQRDKHPWSRVAVKEGCSQPVVLQTGILVDIADLKGTYELPPVIEDTDFIPLKERQDYYEVVYPQPSNRQTESMCINSKALVFMVCPQWWIFLSCKRWFIPLKENIADIVCVADMWVKSFTNTRTIVWLLHPQSD